MIKRRRYLNFIHTFFKKSGENQIAVAVYVFTFHYSFITNVLGILMKKFKKLSELLLVSTSSFLSQTAFAEGIFTSMDDPSTATKPFEATASAGFLAQTGNSKSSSLSVAANMTWFKQSMAYSFWGNAANHSSQDQRSSETYLLGARARYNLTPEHYLFSQASWLSDRFNGYKGRSIFTLGYGHQILSGPVHTLRAEVGPTFRYDQYSAGGNKKNLMLYGGLGYQWQMTQTTQFIQALSILAGENTTITSETGLQLAINEQLSLKLVYNVNWNKNPPASAPKKIDTKTSILLSYSL